MVKANAYGHGLLRAARAFVEADGFAVVELEAAIRLREAGYSRPIVLLEGFFEPRELPVLNEHRFMPAIHSFEQIEMLRAARPGTRLDVLLKVNTGMNRLGFQPLHFSDALERLQSSPCISSVTLMTHFATADDERGIAAQLRVLESLTRAGLPRTIANSAAILRYPESHADWVRPGIMLYGCSPFAECVGATLDLRPAMTLASELIAVRDLAPGDAVGYGSTYVAQRHVRMGVVACGYADGYPRHAPTGNAGARGWYTDRHSGPCLDGHAMRGRDQHRRVRAWVLRSCCGDDGQPRRKRRACRRHRGVRVAVRAGTSSSRRRVALNGLRKRLG